MELNMEPLRGQLQAAFNNDPERPGSWLHSGHWWGGKITKYRCDRAHDLLLKDKIPKPARGRGLPLRSTRAGLGRTLENVTLRSWNRRSPCFLGPQNPLQSSTRLFQHNRSLVPCCALFSQHMHSRHWPLGFHGRLQFAGHSEQKLGEQAQSPPYSHRLPSAFPSFCLCLWSHASSFSHLELVTVLQALPPLSHQVLSTWNVLSCTSTPFYTYWAPTHSSKQSQMPPLPGSLPKSPQLEFLTFSSPILP